MAELNRVNAVAENEVLENERARWLRTERYADAERRDEGKAENEGIHDTRPDVGYRTESITERTDKGSMPQLPRLLKTFDI